MKARDMSRWNSSPLTKQERSRLSVRTAKRLLVGPLEPAEAAEREALRLRYVRTMNTAQEDKGEKST